MDQCSEKCRCLSGVNQDVAYECAQPCEAGYFFESFSCDCYSEGPPCPGGTVMTLTSYIQVRQGVGSSETTFFPYIPGAAPSGPARVIDGVIQVFSDGTWGDVGTSPYAVGDDHNGKTITSIVELATLGSGCACDETSGVTCPTGETCYQEIGADAPAGWDCCPAGNEVRSVYKNEYSTADGGTGSFYSLDAPGQITLDPDNCMDVCTSGLGPSTGPCGPGFTRRKALFVNGWLSSISNSHCNLGISQAYRDCDCFDPCGLPVVSSSTYVGDVCLAACP